MRRSRSESWNTGASPMRLSIQPSESKSAAAARSEKTASAAGQEEPDRLHIRTRSPVRPVALSHQSSSGRPDKLPDTTICPSYSSTTTGEASSAPTACPSPCAWRSPRRQPAPFYPRRQGRRGMRDAPSPPCGRARSGEASAGFGARLPCCDSLTDGAVG
jgi:hypothetical protein